MPEFDFKIKPEAALGASTSRATGARGVTVDTQLNSLADAFALVSNRDSGAQKSRERLERNERLPRFTADEYADHMGVVHRTGGEYVRRMVKQGKARRVGVFGSTRTYYVWIAKSIPEWLKQIRREDADKK